MKTFEIRFPSQGVVRRFSHERTSREVEHPTPWGMNVRQEDDLTSRLRGGSFTPISAGARPEEIVYRDRLLTFSDNAITASRMGDHDDTNFSSNVSDKKRPTLFQLSQAGEVGEDVVALIPHKDAFLLGFAATETWVQTGDPLTGTRRRISDDVGIIGADAWCVNHDTVYFLSSRGLYSVQADGSDLRPLSEDILPEDLEDIDDDDCTLTYNHSDRGVYIHLTTSPSWLYDTARNAFWPFTPDETDSHLLLGPLRIGGVNLFGMIRTLHGIMAANSGTVIWRIVPGNTAEEAAANGKLAITAALADNDFQEYCCAEGAWDAGRSHTEWPRSRCVWCCVWLSSSATWAFESIVLESIPAGRIRL